MRRQKLWLFLALAAAACAGQVPRPTASQVQRATERWPGVTAASLEKGRSLYVLKCSGCHNLRLPMAYSAERWPSILDKMQVKAKLSDDQKMAILHYVLSIREQGAPQ